MASSGPSPARRGIPLPEAERVGALVARLGGEVDPQAAGVQVDRIVAPEQALSAEDLVVLTSSRQLAAAADAAGVVLCQSELAARLPTKRRCAHPHAMWVVAELLAPLSVPEPRGAREAARVESGAELARDVELGAGAVVLAGARIGRGSRIGENAVIHGRVELGERVSVGALAVIGRPGFGWTNAPDGRRVRVPQLGGVVIEDDVEIGPLSSIDSGTFGPTFIGRGARLDAQVHVGHNVRIGAGTLVAAQSGFAGSAEVGEGVLVGGQAGVTDHARIGAGARIAAKSGVIGDVPAGAVVAGFPAVSRARWLRGMARVLSKSRKR